LRDLWFHIYTLISLELGCYGGINPGYGLRATVTSLVCSVPLFRIQETCWSNGQIKSNKTCWRRINMSTVKNT